MLLAVLFALSWPHNVDLKSSVQFTSSLLASTTAAASINQLRLYAFRVKSWAKRYLAGRVLHTSRGTSSFQLERLLLACGDISVNSGPRKKPAPTYPCEECQKNVRSNQDAILCTNCNTWSHAKCSRMSCSSFLYYLNEPNIDWIRDFCALPPLSDSFFLNNSTYEVNTSRVNTTQESVINVSTTETQVSAQDLDQNGYYPG